MICKPCQEVKHSKCKNIQESGQPLGSWCACQHREVVLIKTGNTFTAPKDGSYTFTNSPDSLWTQIEIIQDAGLPDGTIQFEDLNEAKVLSKIKNLGTDV